MKRIWLILVLAVAVFPTAAALQTIQPTPLPTITAEREPWFLSGGPITYEGGIYMPSGARIHFVPNEMVRSGSFRGIPLYERTTIEPYSVIYVPLPGGVMQPYERRRIGELTGTVGSLTPIYPVGPSTGLGSGAAFGSAAQAAGPPMTIPFAVQTETPLAVATSTPAAETPVSAPAPAAAVQPPSSATVGTSGRRSPVPPRTKGVNGLFVDYDNARWFSHGSATLLTPSFVRVGEYHGAPVYRDSTGSPRVIYIPLNRDAQDLVAPFEKGK